MGGSRREAAGLLNPPRIPAWPQLPSPSAVMCMEVRPVIQDPQGSLSAAQGGKRAGMGKSKAAGGAGTWWDRLCQCGHMSATAQRASLCQASDIPGLRDMPRLTGTGRGTDAQDRVTSWRWREEAEAWRGSHVPAPTWHSGQSHAGGGASEQLCPQAGPILPRYITSRLWA